VRSLLSFLWDQSSSLARRRYALRMRKINLDEAFSRFDEQWSPRVVADVNDHQVKLARLEGEFVWHHHEHEDELFLVIDGELTIRLRDGDVHLKPGELFVVPRGVEHQPVADRGEVRILLLEPRTTLNTGEVRNERTVDDPERLT